MTNWFRIGLMAAMGIYAVTVIVGSTFATQHFNIEYLGLMTKFIIIGDDL